MRYINALLMASVLYAPIGCTEKNPKDLIIDNSNQKPVNSQEKGKQPENTDTTKERVIRDMQNRGYTDFDEKEYETLREAERLLRIDSREAYRELKGQTQNSIRKEFEVRRYLNFVSELEDKLNDYHDTYRTIENIKESYLKSIQEHQEEEIKRVLESKINNIESKMRFLEANSRRVFGIMKAIKTPDIDETLERYNNILQHTPDIEDLEKAKRHAMKTIAILREGLKDKNEEDGLVDIQRQMLEDYESGLEYIEQEMHSLRGDVEEPEHN